MITEEAKMLVKLFANLGVAKANAAHLLKAKNHVGGNVLPEPYRSVVARVKLNIEQAELDFAKKAGAKYPRKQIADLISAETTAQQENLIWCIRHLKKEDRDEIENIIEDKLETYMSPLLIDIIAEHTELTREDLFPKRKIEDLQCEDTEAMYAEISRVYEVLITPEITQHWTKLRDIRDYLRNNSTKYSDS